MSRLRPLGRLLRGSHRTAWASVAVAIAQALTLIPIALLIRRAFDESIPSGDAGEVTLIGLAALALYLVSAVLGLWARAISLRATKQSVTELRGDLLTKIYALPRSWFDHRDAAKVHGTIVQDSERIDQMTHALVAQLMPAGVVAIGLTGAMLVLNPLLFGLLALISPLLLLCSAVVGRAVRRRTRVWREQFEAFDSQTMFALRSITLTKAHGADAGEVAARREQIEALGRRGFEMSWMQSAYALVNGTIMAIGAVIVLIVGGRAVANGSMSLGDLISFFSLLALLRGQTPTLLTAIPSVISGMESLRRVEEVLAAGDEEPYRGGRHLRFDGRLGVEGVEFSYDGPPVLQDVSLHLDPGERLVVVGPNGAGKSTLVSLILGLYRPQRGRLTADGVPYDELDMRSLRASIGVVMQDPIVFSGSVRQNISFGTAGLDDAAIRTACDLATASGFVDRLPAGLETQVGDEGVLLSGGQRQRLAIARALARRPSLLILDEPTTYLDAASAAELIDNLRRLEPAPAVLLVTHDPLVAAHGDRCVELRDGRLAAEVAI